jgi:putative spermidine/putrescine transport system permease protein
VRAAPSTTTTASASRPGGGAARTVGARVGHWLAVAPFLALLALVVVVPTGVFLQHAFEGGFSGWSSFLDDAGKVRGVARTVDISLQTTAICAVLGYVYARVLVGAGGRRRAVLLALLVVPFLTSTLVRTYGWVILLGGTSPLPKLVSRALPGADVQLLYTRTGLLVGMAQIMLPLFVLPLYAVWSAVPASLTRASRTLGANRVEAFLRVELPLTLPGAAAGAVLVFITSLGFFIAPALLGGDADTMAAQLMDNEIYREVDLAGAAVIATMLLVAVLLCVAVFRVAYPLELLFVQSARQAAPARRRLLAGLPGRVLERPPLAAWRDSLRRGRLTVTAAASRAPWAPMAALGGGLIAAFLVLPLFVVLPVAFSGDSFLVFPPERLGLRWFEAVRSDPAWRQVVANSLLTGTLATGIAVAVGLPVAFALVRSRLHRGVKGLLVLLAAVPILVPIAVLALGVFAWLLDLRLSGGTVVLALAHAMLGVPFVIFIAMAALRDLDVRLERAARSLGAGAVRTLRLVTLPLVRPAVLAGMLFAFLQSFDELLIARAVTDEASATLPVKLWEGANQEISPALAAVSVISIAVTLAAATAMAMARRRRRR